MSICATQDRILLFHCTFGNTLHSVLPVTSVMDQLSYALSMFN